MISYYNTYFIISQDIFERYCIFVKIADKKGGITKNYLENVNDSCYNIK